ncbi:Zinc finger, BED-type [Phytophthora cactorum]|nr:Zinc finger, BED-type [Phytophthora cactorum]
MPLATKDIYSLLFAKKDDGRYQCTTCTKLYTSTHGHTNLLNHLKRHHPTFEADAQEATKRHNALQLRVVDPQTVTVSVGSSGWLWSVYHSCLSKARSSKR